MNIEWNKVTWYSKLLAVALLLLVIFAGYILGGKKVDRYTDVVTEIPIVNDIDTIFKDGNYCFYRNQIATKSEPYSVKENIILSINGELVNGTKIGTQNGPDMTNGYFGDLEGTKKDNIISLVYSYTVEGSKNKELEVYELIDDNTLVKMRWPLKEEKGVLVPIKTGEPTRIIYNVEKCTS